MKENMNNDDAKLSALLHESRVSPELPPRFQQNVWRRIEKAEAPVKSESWLEALAALILRPKFAFASVAVLLAAGIVFGTLEGTQTARHDAQVRYLASVAPDSLR
jgi:hypothetical protein